MNTTLGRGYPEPPKGTSRSDWAEHCDRIAQDAFCRAIEPNFYPSYYHWLGAEAEGL